tara:strand:- start:770 stop:1978 length:1209 start_codon:yes stop_codon:yes gene_type:complete
MDRVCKRGRTTRLIGTTAAFATFVLGACSEVPANRVITEQRTVASAPFTILPNPTPGQRFGNDPVTTAGNPSTANTVQRPEFWAPETWTEVDPVEFRDLNFEVTRDPAAKAWLTVMGGSGGGLLANVNRWRGEVGLEPATEADLMNLAMIPIEPGLVAGDTIPFLVLDGDYSGSAGQIQGARSLAAIVSASGASLFVKMVGPKATVEAEQENFVKFTQEIVRLAHMDPTTGAPMAPPNDAVHGGAGSGMDMTDTSGIVPEASENFEWTVPEGWKRGGDRMMREATWMVSDLAECYLALAGGDTLTNANRWRQQIGMEAYSAAEFAGLARIPMLGGEGILVEGEGTFTGFGAGPVENAALIGLICSRPGKPTVFVKMTGPVADVHAATEDFMAFAKSLEEGSR